MPSPLLSSRFANDGRPSVQLSLRQQTARRTMLAAIQNGAYQKVLRSCQLCGGTEATILAEKDFYGLPFVTGICCTCGMLRTLETLRSQDYDHFYANIYRELYGSNQNLAAAFAKARPRGERFLSLANVYATAKPVWRVLEVGCGTGGNLAPFAGAGHQTAGYDLDGDCVAYGRSRGLDLRVASLEKVSADETYDIIIVSHLLEHLTEIRGSLVKLRGLLSPDGCIIAEVPGLFTIGWQRCRWNVLTTLHPAHVVQMSGQMLSRFFVETGFEDVYGDEVARGVFRKSESQASRSPRTTYRQVNDFIREVESKYRRYLPLARLHAFYRGSRTFAGRILRGRSSGENAPPDDA